MSSFSCVRMCALRGLALTTEPHHHCLRNSNSSSHSSSNSSSSSSLAGWTLQLCMQQVGVHLGQVDMGANRMMEEG